MSKEYKVISGDSQDIVAIFMLKHLAEQYAFDNDHYVIECTDGIISGVSDIRYHEGVKCGVSWQWVDHHEETIHELIERRERQQLAEAAK